MKRKDVPDNASIVLHLTTEHYKRSEPIRNAHTSMAAYFIWYKFSSAYYSVHALNIVERNCQQRWPTIPLVSTKWTTTSHFKSLNTKIPYFSMEILVLDLGTQKCGGIKTVNEISLFPLSVISCLSQLTSGHCWLVLGSINMYLFYHCSSPVKSGHTYSTIQWNALNLHTCWESISASRVFYRHWGKII